MTPTPTVPARLYHYTCTTHGEPGIRDKRAVLPSPHPLLRTSLAWLTDLDFPDRWALGLTSATLCCDRTTIRVTVDTDDNVVPWWYFARIHRDRIPPILREVIEADGMPLHWWVSPAPVPAAAVMPTVTARRQGAKR